MQEKKDEFQTEKHSNFTIEFDTFLFRLFWFWDYPVSMIFSSQYAQ